MNFPKKIPTLLALFILFFIIGAISFLVQKVTSSKTSASPSTEPINLTITNVSDTSAKVIWQTTTATTGMVILETKSNTKINAYDERDVAGKLIKYTNHSVAIKNLQPNTTYNMKVLSDGKEFPAKDKPAYTLQTGQTIMDDTLSSGFEPSYGMVKTNDGKPASGGLLVITLEDSQPISTLITGSGSWIIPLNFIRTKDLSRYIPTKSQMTETIIIYYGTQITEGITDTDNDAPVGDMTIGNTYDFRNQQTKRKATNTLASTDTGGAVLGTTAPTSTPVPGKIGGVAITAPVQNTSLVSNRPLIQGTGIPQKTVTITLGIAAPVSGKTTVGANGLWSFTPAKPLSNGKQSVTITTVDDKGKAIALTTTFTILKAGSQVLGDATPSATIEPTPEASITAEPMPEPGTWEPTALLLLVGIGLVTGGFVLLR